MSSNSIVVHKFASPPALALETGGHVLTFNACELESGTTAVELDFLASNEFDELPIVRQNKGTTADGVCGGCLGVYGVKDGAEDHLFVVLIHTSSQVVPAPSHSAPFSGTGSDPIHRLTSVSFHCLTSSSPDYADTTASAPSHPCYPIAQILNNHNFYFSADPRFDITSRLAARVSSRRKERFFDLPLTAETDDHDVEDFPSSDWECDPDFLFNLHLLSPVLQFRQVLPRSQRKVFDELGLAVRVIEGTNMVKAMCSLFALDQYVKDVDLLDKLRGSKLESLHRVLWSENGDAVSQIYTGAGALNTIFTRTGRHSDLDTTRNKQKAELRIEQALYRDKGKQAAIDRLVGGSRKYEWAAFGMPTEACADRFGIE
ncbi:inositol or phosphatidylinositol phosphatase [Pseudohyphozyma bogoriensis]|nr:inositol or phosphatidylinositol phosphatase [Pseudohyphozyma bogoriensis]